MNEVRMMRTEGAKTEGHAMTLETCEAKLAELLDHYYYIFRYAGRASRAFYLAVDKLHDGLVDAIAADRQEADIRHLRP